MPGRSKFGDADVARMVELFTTTTASTRDIAKVFNCGRDTVRRYLRVAGTDLSALRGSKITAKQIGKPSNRKGKKHSPESLAKMRAREYSDENLQNIREGVRRRDERRRAAGLLLTEEERATRKRTGDRCRGFLKRLLNLTGERKTTKTAVALGYTKEELRSHIEAQFRPGMSWEAGNFHIDHVIPVCWFLSQGITDPAIINALSNLQPLFPSENWRKGGRY